MIFSARWAGRHGDDGANLDLLLAQLADVPPEHRGGAFVCAAAVAVPGGGAEHVELGELRGHLVAAPSGGGGFGYDPVFVPGDAGRTLAEHTAQEKNAVSHRGLAFRALAPRLAELLAAGPIHPGGSSEPTP